MIELLIPAFALTLFLYWFRYSCLAILHSARPRDRVVQVAIANQLYFVAVQDRLQNEVSSNEVSEDELDDFDRALLRDYQVLTCLLRYTSGLRARVFTLDQRILMIDFKLMRWLYALTRRWAIGLSKKTLAERTEILEHFANTVADRSAAVARP